MSDNDTSFKAFNIVCFLSHCVPVQLSVFPPQISVIVLVVKNNYRIFLFFLHFSHLCPLSQFAPSKSNRLVCAVCTISFFVFVVLCLQRNELKSVLNDRLCQSETNLSQDDVLGNNRTNRTANGCHRSQCQENGHQQQKQSVGNQSHHNTAMSDPERTVKKSSFGSFLYGNIGSNGFKGVAAKIQRIKHQQQCHNMQHSQNKWKNDDTQATNDSNGFQREAAGKKCFFIVLCL